jgi:hypothetical protein
MPAVKATPALKRSFRTDATTHGCWRSVTTDKRCERSIMPTKHLQQARLCDLFVRVSCQVITKGLEPFEKRTYPWFLRMSYFVSVSAAYTHVVK